MMATDAAGFAAAAEGPEGQDDAPIVWSKKVQLDRKRGVREATSGRQLEAERLSELERVRARRCAHSSV